MRPDISDTRPMAWSPVGTQAEVRSTILYEGTTRYREPRQTYSNLWVIKLEPDGRCREFTEWWMLQPEPDSVT